MLMPLTADHDWRLARSGGDTLVSGGVPLVVGGEILITDVVSDPLPTGALFAQRAIVAGTGQSQTIGGIPIPGAVLASYLVQPGDLGKRIFCRVRATNAIGFAEKNAVAVGPITEQESGLINTVAPLVTGTVADGQLLSCDTGTWEGDPTSITYQWYAVLTEDDGTVFLDDNGRALGQYIDGARSSTYIVNGIPYPPESTWNEVDVTRTANGESTLIFSNDNKTVLGNLNGCTRGTQARSTGKRYFEITVDQVNDYYIGFGGICDDTHTLLVASYPGLSNSKGVIVYIHVFAGNSYVSAQGGSAAGSPTWAWGVGDVLGIACDLDLRQFWCHRNGTWFSMGPPSGPGVYWGTATQPRMKPYIEVNSTTDPTVKQGKFTLNTGVFAYPLPTGFVAWESP